MLLKGSALLYGAVVGRINLLRGSRDNIKDIPCPGRQAATSSEKDIVIVRHLLGKMFGVQYFTFPFSTCYCVLLFYVHGKQLW